LSTRVKSIKPSPTLAVTAKAAELRASGIDVIGLGAGEPDFDTPTHIKEAAISAINEGHTKYTPVGGTPQLKEAIVNKLKRDNKLNYGLENILVSCGAKQSIFNLMSAILNPRDEVIIPAPYWVSYPDMSKIFGASPVIIPTSMDANFKLSAQQLEESISTKTKLLILNSPSNPTGAVYTKDELTALGEIIAQYPNMMVISDDIYEHIIWTNEPFNNIASACPDIKDQVMVVNGVSKAYAMTGWRIGYAAGNANIIKAMTKIQGQSTSNPSSISQQAAISALNSGLDAVTSMVKEFKSRHDYLVQALNSIPLISCLPGQGAFYAFPYVGALIKNIPNVNNDTEFAEHLLSEAQIAVVPGSAFGSPDFIRISFATSKEVLETAITRLTNYVHKHNNA
ncbi:MAG: pyridoxal phosphate-dependent aminotransferase, partial [Francisellaceae bacterium]|nr:pyridoxal phosphate-dependent aminotransferase [Francisellaceae bacterium]